MMLGRQAWREASLVSVDLEMTGLHPERDQVIALGAVPIEGGRIQVGSAYYSLAHPVPGASNEAVPIHGILPHDLDDAPTIEEAVRPLIELLRGRVPVVHAGWVERSFLGPLLRRHGSRLPRRMIDTRILWRLLNVERGMPDPGPQALGTIAEAVGVPAEHPHHALSDALTTAQVLLALATHLDTIRPQTVGSLTSAGSHLATMKMYRPDLA
jgi:DNA polymerase III subunit epsilon